MKKLMALALMLFAAAANADKRFYLCDVIGDGTEFNPYRVSVADLRVNYVAVIPSDPDTGVPLFNWALTRISAPNHSELIHVCDPMPDFPMDGKVAGINNAVKTQMKNRVRNRTGQSAGWIDHTDGYREVIRGIGQFQEPAFDENNFDVAE